MHLCMRDSERQTYAERAYGSAREVVAHRHYYAASFSGTSGPVFDLFAPQYDCCDRSQNLD
eukprot:SAG31_NODE_113_length_24342_cov_5.194530_9_plen_61_part_00